MVTSQPTRPISTIVAMSELTDYEQLRQNPSLFVSEILGIEPFSYQKSFLDADGRHRAIASGRQVGKSRMCAWLALHKAITNSHTRVLITAPSLRQSSLLFDTLYSEIEQSGMSDEQWGVERDTQTIIEFDNGSSIHCLPTGRNGNKIRGFTADMVIVDESAFIDDPIFEDILQPMLFATSGRMVLASTPWGESGFFYQSWSKGDGSSKWDSFQVSSYDSPLIEDGDLEEFKEGKTQAQIDREVLGVFVEDSGQFFKAEHISNCMPGGAPERVADNAYLGVDIAGTGDDRTVFHGVDEMGNVFLNDEAHDEMGVLEAAEYIKTLDNNYGFERIFVDRTAIGQGTVEALANDPSINRKHESVYFTLQKKQQIYQRLKAALEAGFLHLPHDKTLRNELESIGSQKTSAGNLKLFPRSNDTGTGRDDYVDSLALACWGLPDFGGNAGQSNGAKQAVFSGGGNRSRRHRNSNPRRGHSFSSNRPKNWRR